MNASPLIAREIGPDQYRGWLDTAPGASVFHTLEWLDAVNRCYRSERILLGFFRNDALVCCLPLHRRRIGPLWLYGSPLRRIGTPPATFPPVAEADAGQFLAALDAWLVAQRVPFFQLSWPFAATALPGSAWAQESSDNLAIDLSPPLEELWNSVVKAQRYEVRKAVRAGLRLHWKRPASFRADYLVLLAETYGAQGLRPNVPEGFYAAVAASLGARQLRVLSVSHAGVTLAAAWLLFDGRRCYYWDAASTGEGRRKSASHLLVWALMRWARRRKLAVLDMVGTSIGGRGGSRPGIGKFKQSFGARAHAYRILYRRGALVALALKAYRHWLAIVNKPKLNA